MTRMNLRRLEKDSSTIHIKRKGGKKWDGEKESQDQRESKACFSKAFKNMNLLIKLRIFRITTRTEGREKMGKN